MQKNNKRKTIKLFQCKILYFMDENTNYLEIKNSSLKNQNQN